MRWAGQEISGAAETDPSALPGLDRLQQLVRTVQTPEFAGITFHEVLAKSALNRVPGAARVPLNWTINPYRGCSHGCVYCFARRTHTYLDLDSGNDFDSQIIVKLNVAEVLARELHRPSWGHEPVALGTNTDPYQRAEMRNWMRHVDERIGNLIVFNWKHAFQKMASQWSDAELKERMAKIPSTERQEAWQRVARTAGPLEAFSVRHWMPDRSAARPMNPPSASISRTR